MCIKTYEADPAKSLKKTKVKLDLLIDIDMLLMVEKGIRGGIRHSIYQAKAKSKYIKNYNKNKKSSYIQYWDVNNLCGWVMPQKLLVNNFEWIEDGFRFNQDFIKKTIMKKVINDIFLKLMLNILKNYLTFRMIYHFYLKELQLKKSESLSLIYMIKLNILFFLEKNRK